MLGWKLQITQNIDPWGDMGVIDPWGWGDRSVGWGDRSEGDMGIIDPWGTWGWSIRGGWGDRSVGRHGGDRSVGDMGMIDPWGDMGVIDPWGAWGDRSVGDMGVSAIRETQSMDDLPTPHVLDPKPEICCNLEVDCMYVTPHVYCILPRSEVVAY